MNTYSLYDIHNRERRRISDLEIHNAQLFAACDSVDKLNYVNGVISLHEYLMRESRHTKRLNGIAKTFDNHAGKM